MTKEYILQEFKERFRFEGDSLEQIINWLETKYKTEIICSQIKSRYGGKEWKIELHCQNSKNLYNYFFDRDLEKAQIKALNWILLKNDYYQIIKEIKI